MLWLGSETEMLVKKKRKKKRGKEDDKKDCDVAMRLSVEDDRSVILNAWELLLITRIIRK